MFEPGSILIVAEKPDVLYVTVKKNLGYAVDVGWILYTTGGNYLFVNMEEKDAGLKYMQRVLFVTDPSILATLPKVKA